MELSLINKLNQLDQDFYQQITTSFDQTRQYSWQGWTRLLPNLEPMRQPISVLDLGCGNARFANFLDENDIQFSYHGVDSSQSLLDKASHNLKQQHLEHKLNQLDIVQALLDGSLSTILDKKYDLIVAFGLFHHLPSFKLRKKFIEDIGGMLADKQSLAVVTAWQFAADKRFEEKFIDPSKINLSADQLEENDFILGWQNHPNAFRYCHFVDESEIKKITAELKKITLLESFFSDGKSEKLNKYLIFKRELKQ